MSLHITAETLRIWLTHYGYWALVAVLLLENAGLPLPGESVLFLAGLMASKHTGLSLQWVILLGIIAATLGDNIGFLVGARGGRPLIDRYGRIFHITPTTIAKAEERLQRHGAAVIFGARFLAGFRVIAGPAAGALHMPWEKFALFNFLGAAAWVTLVCTIGYLGGGHLHRFVGYARDIEFAAGMALVVFVLWRIFCRSRYSHA